MLQSLVALTSLVAAERPVAALAATPLPGPADQPAAVVSATGRRSHWLLGAAIGFGAGAVVTYLVLHSGGSTAPCNRSANQDAMSGGECLGLTALGGVAGAGLGALVGGLVKRAVPETPVERIRITPVGDRGLQVSLAVRF
ncbi:MAG: hypothetical protein FJ206_00975 [Gemmatimonadetes bacterium]|nr:hypothetical protein [Gemmatimonadota bacterium]